VLEKFFESCLIFVGNVSPSLFLYSHFATTFLHSLSLSLSFSLFLYLSTVFWLRLLVARSKGSSGTNALAYSPEFYKIDTWFGGLNFSFYFLFHFSCSLHLSLTLLVDERKGERERVKKGGSKMGVEKERERRQ
jgi:hypothetical protein